MSGEEPAWMVSLALFDLINISCTQRRGYLSGILDQSSGALRAVDLQCCDTRLKWVQDFGLRPEEKILSSMRENMLHKISAGRREMRDNSFLRDFRARMLSSSRAISRSMILRISSFGSPAEYEAWVLSGKRTTWISDLNF